MGENKGRKYIIVRNVEYEIESRHIIRQFKAIRNEANVESEAEKTTGFICRF